jgi:hypothetical protein
VISRPGYRTVPVSAGGRDFRDRSDAEAPGGGDAPFLIEASTSQGGVNLQVPRDELPTEEWWTIKSIVRDLELEERDWAVDLLAGYLCQSLVPWER